MNDILNQSLIANYDRKYGAEIDVVAESMREKFKYEWRQEDTEAFGRYADTWSGYRPIFESDTTARNALGPALSDNLGLVAMAYASLPIQNFASVQPLNDEAGTVYYRNAIAVNARGEVQAGDNLITPHGQINNKVASYTNETQVKSLAIADTATVSYTITLGKELIPGQTRLVISGGKIKGQDDGEGHILGVGIDAEASTIDYTTGAVAIKFTDLAGKGVQVNDTIDFTYSHSTVAANEVPTMKWVLETQIVRAEYFVLQSQYSHISEVILKKKFGADLDTQVGADLVAQISGGVMYQAIAKLRAAAIKTELDTGVSVTWASAQSGVAEIDHRRTFEDTLIEAVSVMYKAAGKGDISTLIVGTKGKQILTSAGMQTVRSSVSGPHLCGMYGTTPVYYAPNTSVGDNEVIVVYRGANWYESPIVYAPFLPLTTVSGKAVGNVLVNAQAAYHAAGIETVKNGFCVRISIV